MSVSYSPDPVTPALRGVPFSQTVTFSYSSGSITSVNAVYNEEGDEIEVTNSSSSFTISGRYLSGWSDIFSYVEAGESVNTAPTQTAINIANMPDDKNLFNLTQDMAAIVTKTYSVTVSYYDTDTMSSGTTTITVPHDVNNDWEAIRYYMDNYNYNGTGG